MTWSKKAYESSRVSLQARLDREFWSKYRADGECWVWTGITQTRSRTGAGGYGTIRRRGHQVFAHRYAYETAVGPIPVGLIVMHTCDNPPCINPTHLRLGTKADNTADMWAKGRGWVPRKLTSEDVSEIRGSSDMAGILAARFGVSRQHIRAIQRRDTWKAVA